MRDDFTQSTKNILAKRVGCRCSNPSCKKLTNGPHKDSSKALNIGVAAHITAAASGGPRYDASLSSERRKSIENGIWRCQNCGKSIDSDSQKFPISLLMTWKQQAEEWAGFEIENSSPGFSRLDSSGLVRYLQDMVDASPVWWLPEINESTWYEFELLTQVWEESKKRDRKLEDSKIQSLQDAIDESRVQSLLIIGDPGSGKSTFLEKLAIKAARKALDDSNSEIPVLIRLKDYESSGDFPGFRGLIYFTFENYLGSEAVDQLLRDRKLLLLIDGWNELSDEKAKSKIKRFCQPHSIVVTSRSAGDYSEIKEVFEIQPLSRSDVQNFFNTRLPNAKWQDLEKLVNRVQDFGQTPLMVWMLFSIFCDDGSIPGTRGEAYQSFTRLYAKRAKAGIDLSNARELLGKLAFEMMKSPNPESPIEFQLKVPEVQAEQILGSETDLNRMLNHLLKQQGREISFCHQSLQEYYAAEHLRLELANHPKWLEAKDEEGYSWFQIHYLNYMKWKEPIALMLGLPEINQQMAITIVEQALNVDLMLGARLAGEVRSEFHKEIVDFIHDEITLKNLPEWVQVEIWGRVGSDYAINELLKFLNRDDIELVTRAAGFIGDTSNQNAIWTISNRLEKIDKIFSDQTTFGGIDKTHLVWMKHIQALRNVNPRKFVSFLKEKLNTEKRNTIIQMCNESIRWLVQLDKNTVKEMINVLKDSKDENFKHDYILNILEVAKFDQNDISEMLKIFEANSFEPIKIRIINIICNTDFDFLGDELVKIISCLSDEVSYKLRDEVSKNIISRGMDKLDVNSLEELLFSCDFEVRYFAAIILGSTDNLLAIPVLISSMCLDDLWIRRKTIQIFHYIKEEKIIIPLLRHYLKDLDPVICREAAFSLSYFGRDDGINEIMSALGQGPLETYYKSIRSLGRLNHREPLWKLIHQKRSEAEYAQFGHWQPVAIELLKLGEMDVFPEICETLLNLNCQSSTEVMNLVAKYADISTVDWLIKVLEEPQRYRTDPYALNRIALTLRRIPVEIIQQRIMQLIVVSQKTHIHQLSWLLPEIQSRSNFYNYEIEQQAKLRKADRASLEGGGGDSHSEKIRDRPVVQNFYGPVYGVAGNVEGDQIISPPPDLLN